MLQHKANKFGRLQLNACLTFRGAAIQSRTDCNFQQTILRPFQLLEYQMDGCAEV